MYYFRPLFVLLVLNAISAEETKTAFVTEGNIQGKITHWLNPLTKTEVEIHSFLGIPFAEPPVGALRFQLPKAVTRWNGTMVTNETRNQCMSSSGGNEDCLYVNIWKPKLFVDVPLPVLVWIPGGGFADEVVITEEIASNFVAISEVILATISYRRGPFGFLHSGTKEIHDNVGLFDQQMAIKWIQNNILYLDGDPKSVTLIGENTGAASAALHLLAKGSTNLFRRVVLLSGSAESPWFFTSRSQALNVTEELLQSTGCKSEGISCLKTLPAKEIQEASHPQRFDFITSRPFPYVPVVDGTFLTDKPSSLVPVSFFQRTEVLLGVNSKQGMLIVDRFMKIHPDFKFNKLDDVLKLLESFLPGTSKATKFRLLLNYFESGTFNQTEDISNFSNLLTDSLFLCPSMEMANAYSEMGRNVFFYRFQGTRLMESEAAYFLMVPFLPHQKFSEMERIISRQMSAQLSYFVAEGVARKWPKYTEDEAKAMTFSTETLFKASTIDYDGSNCQEWATLIHQ